MFVSQMHPVGDTIVDLVYAFWNGTLDVAQTPSFQYIIQNLGSGDETGAVSIGNAQSGLSAGEGYLLNLGKEFWITLPAPYRLGLIAAVAGTPAYVSVTMVQQ